MYNYAYKPIPHLFVVLEMNMKYKMKNMKSRRLSDGFYVEINQLPQSHFFNFNRHGACFFGGGARFDLAASRSRLFVGCTQILLSRFHTSRDGATVLKVGGR